MTLATQYTMVAPVSWASSVATGGSYYIQLFDPNTGLSYTSINAAVPGGPVSFASIPNGRYQVYVSAQRTGPFTAIPGADGWYVLAADSTGATDLVAHSLTVLSSGPYTPAASLDAGGILAPVHRPPSPPPGQFLDAIGGAGKTDVANWKFYRNANYTGGTHGFVNSAIRVQTDVGANTTAYEWGIVSIINDNSTDATQENVAIVGQTNKNTVGGAWASVFQATDQRGLADTTGALICIECDLTAAGTDANTQRLGIDIVLGYLGSGPSPAHASIGLRVNAGANAFWDTGILIKSIASTGVALEIQPASAATGINLVSGTFSTAALRFARQQLITMENTNTFDIQMLGASDSILKFRNSGTEKVGIDMNTGLRMNAVQVVTARQTGYTNAWTGTLERATARDASTVTLVQLAQRVAAMQTDLVTHGLLGP